MKELSLLKTLCVVFVFCAATAIASPAQVLTTLHSFWWGDGAYPDGVLAQASDGNFYGTTAGGGGRCDGGCGTVFKITPSGTLTTLYSFCAQYPSCTDGANPAAGLVQATDGNFYGTTVYGGANDVGTVFKITPAGTLTTLHSFGGSGGGSPYAGLIQAIDGNFYGTAEWGGAYGDGTVFKITPSGTLTTLYSFCSQQNCPDGGNPTAALVQATDGNFYGTTTQYGARGYCKGYGCGTVFKITPAGTLTTLYSFCSQPNCADGISPNAGLVQASDGYFYGTTPAGGANGDGTVFRITPSGTLTTLYSFCAQSGCTDGANPYAGLVQSTDGNLYGTTEYDGAYGAGTVFKITLSGTLSTLYGFCSQGWPCPDGYSPSAGLAQATDRSFYGTTSSGGAHDYGTVFRLVSVRPCVSCPLEWK